MFDLVVGYSLDFDGTRDRQRTNGDVLLYVGSVTEMGNRPITYLLMPGGQDDLPIKGERVYCH